MKFLVQTLASIVLIGLGVAWAVSMPRASDTSTLAGLQPDLGAGQQVFLAAGCGSCHVAPGSSDKTVLAGGYKMVSPFGTFLSPNISSDPIEGIGAWTLDSFATALRDGISPEGQHYYPAFPYASYARMTDQDVVDLFAYMQTLPASGAPSQPHQLGFPFNLRQGIGLWKARYAGRDWVMTEAPTPELERGRYLVEALGHCAECHTPRDLLGGLDRSAWMMGAPNPSGDGRIPAIAPTQLDWLAEDIAYYLESGFTPSFDVAGKSMRPVVDNYAQLPAADRLAVAAYLKALP